MKTFYNQWRGCWLLLFLMAGGLEGVEATVVWSGGTGLWHEAGNWTPSEVPGPGADVQIGTGAVVLLAAPTEPLGSLTIFGGSVIFSNWTTCLSATNITVLGGTVTCLGPFTNGGESNRVWIVCSNLLVRSPGTIQADAKGYAGGFTIDTNTYYGHGPNGGQPQGDGASGGGHGGRGGSGYGIGRTGTNGVPEAPITHGSGGASPGALRGGQGGHGGGVIRIEASGTVTVEGLVSANGGNAGITGSGSRAAGGAGGSIWISCSVFQGTNGVLSANGGSPKGGSSSMGGGGGGGRIAILNDPLVQSSFPPPRVVLSVAPANGYANDAQLGSLYLNDPVFFASNWMPHAGNLLVPGLRSVIWDTLTITNGRFVFFGSPDLSVTVQQSVAISGTSTVFMIRDGQLRCASLSVTNGAALYVGFADTDRFAPATVQIPTILCAGDMFIGSNATVGIYSAETNATRPLLYGSMIQVGGTLHLGAFGKLRPYSAQTNGASPYIRVGSLVIETNGQINADSLGFAGALSTGAAGYGPGRGLGTGNNNSGGGGGYGGKGGNAAAAGGSKYGSDIEPRLPGSGGGAGNGYAGRGGGLVWVESTGQIRIDGVISANGQDGTSTSRGSGSGGAIYLRCRRFEGGTNAILRANGGSGGGGGGGGRIAIWYGITGDGPIPSNRLEISETTPPPTFQATSFPSVVGGLPGGTYQAGENGTVRFVRVLNPSGTIIFLR